MKVFHICLSCFYIDEFSYQENELVKQHVKDGHDVTVVASTEVFDQKRKLSYCSPGTYLGTDGAKVVRLPYRNFLPHFVMKKLRMHPGLRQMLEDGSPDVILFHGLCGWELLTVSSYCKDNPGVIFNVDSHEDYHNSAKTFVSKYVLHKLYYRVIVQQCLKAIGRVLCVTPDTEFFVRKMYGVPKSETEFFPLGGELFNDEVYQQRRSRFRDKLVVSGQTIVVSQTGKMGKLKKLTDSLEAFINVVGNDENFLFVIAGEIGGEIEASIGKMIEGRSNVRVLGWQNVEEMRDLICGTDLYLQPGTQSSSMQMSLCARCPVILNDLSNHKPYVNDNGWLVRSRTDIERAFEEVISDSAILEKMSESSYAIASKLLDYKSLASRVLR